MFSDVPESDEASLLVVDLPGATRDTVSVGSADGRLYIEARREKDVPAEFTYRREDRPLFLDAELPLPSDADGAVAEALVERGVLEVRVPKAASRGKHIPVE